MRKHTRIAVATAAIAVLFGWAVLQPGTSASDTCAEAASMQVEAAQPGTIDPEAHGAILETSLVEVTVDPCPAEYECTAGPGDCQKAFPPQCSTVDTGEIACSIGVGKLRCPPGQTIHVTNCDCEAISPGEICLNEDQHWNCQ